MKHEFDLNYRNPLDQYKAKDDLHLSTLQNSQEQTETEVVIEAFVAISNFDFGIN